MPRLMAASAPFKDPVVLGNAVLVLGHLGVFAATHFPQWSFQGAPTYRAIAENLTYYGFYSIDGVSPTCYRPPLYPVFLAAVIALTRDAYVYAAPLIQFVSSVAAGILTSATAGRVFNSRRAAGIAASLYGLHVFLLMEHFVARETVLFTLIISTAGWTLVGSSGWRVRCCALGIIGGLAYLTRPTGNLVPGATLMLITVGWVRGELSASDWARRVALVTTVSVLVASPWLYYTATQFDRVFASASCTYGQSFVVANNPLISTRIYPWIDRDRWTKFLWEPAPRTEKDYLRREDRYLAQGIAYFKEHPGKAVRIGLMSVLALYSPLAAPFGYGTVRMVDGRLELFDYKPRSLGSRIVVGGYTVLLFAGVIGHVIVRRNVLAHRDRLKLEMFAVVLLAGLTIVHALSTGETRYRLPFDPLLMIFAAGFFAGPPRADERSVGVADPA